MAVAACEKEFVTKALTQSLRYDGRAVFEARPSRITLGKARGEVEFRIVAVVKAEIVRPFVDRPFEGLLSFYVTWSPGAAAAEDSDLLEEDEQAVQRALDRIFKTSRAIDTESLCILTGEQVWSIRVDIHVVDFDGNALDAAGLAALAALLDFRRPDISVAGGQVKVFSAFERNPVPLAIHHHPICISFALFELVEHPSSECPSGRIGMVRDANLIESKASSSILTLAVNQQRELCTILKSGGIPVDLDVIKRDALEIALKEASEIGARLHDVLKTRK